MATIGTFTDNATKYIIALDYDGTITKRNEFPRMGELREYAKEVMNLLYNIGVAVVVWTCRDSHHLIPLEQYLHDNEIRYSCMNSSIEHAPFEYEARKIYAHMYVDDRGFGWKGHNLVMLEVLQSFMIEVMGMKKFMVEPIIEQIINGEEINVDEIKDYLHGRRVL